VHCSCRTLPDCDEISINVLCNSKCDIAHKL
jgi:hypothetical protein